MRHVLGITLLSALAASSVNADDHPQVELVTTKGRIVLELYPDKAPATVENFLSYVREDFYAGTVFHRVIPDFMVQGGGFTEAMQKKPTKAPIQNEADNGLKNTRGTIAMARTNDPHSATAQFFLNSVDNSYLDHRSKSAAGWGYTVFGRVIEGMDVVDAISGVETGMRSGMRDVPKETILIESSRVLEASGSDADADADAG